MNSGACACKEQAAVTTFKDDNPTSQRPVSEKRSQMQKPVGAHLTEVARAEGAAVQCDHIDSSRVVLSTMKICLFRMNGMAKLKLCITMLFFWPGLRECER